ncbi:MAG: DUF4838 domain-containing protein [Planctomycetaceae bacterium]|nr:DUF4838 domain-containing protein [Planctomycetales bacterium]MCB9874181.1 DUF4838 domain-containing protein [Planctomycetaceae bacterium]MCB9941644.1 DUF4838 domain-containing protein [Planctomycetaceae bacterium]
MSKAKHRFRRACRLFAFAGFLVAPLSSLSAKSPTELCLSSDGQAQLSVVVSPAATPDVREAAEDLADYLSRMTGAAFRVESGDAARGIVVGLVSSFTDLPFEVEFPSHGVNRDQYLLQTTESGLYLLGTTPAAIQCAVWDLLHRQGYRLFFLTDTWEVVPDCSNLSVALNEMEQPDYVTRQAPRGAPWSDRELWTRWHTRNRMNSSFSLNTGHAYGSIVRRNQKAFDQHPEYFALVGGERPNGPNAKFCVSNAALRQLVTDDAVREMKAQPERDSISMDPSDGGGWCECEACRLMGSPSDRALTLANEAAAAINDLELGKKYVGMYAYNDHSPPPNTKAHPNVVISVATSFIRGGYSIEQLVSGWQAQDAVIGIRDYHDVFAWSHDLPRSARGGKIDYLTRTIPWFYEHGARFMNSENMDSWGANGLGYWLTPQLLWDVDNAERVDELIEDFLVHAFATAKEPMREFYQLINRDHDSVRSHQDVVARMYRNLDQARQLTGDPRVRARLDDLILYTRYLELYGEYRNADGKARQRGFERVWRHAYRMRDRMMLSTVALCDRDRFRDRSVQVPVDLSLWQSSKPFDATEIAAMLAAGIAANQPTVLNFEAKKYSDDLVPATRLNLPHVAPGGYDERGRGRQQVYTWLPGGRRNIELDVTGGLIKHYRDRGNVKFSLYSPQEVTLDAVDQDDSVLPDGQQRRIVLTSPYSGLHRLEWTDGSDMTRVVLPADLPLTIRSTLEDPMRLGGRWDLYFYVPRGTKVVGGFTDSTRGTMLDGNRKVIFDFSTMEAAGYFSVAVPEGQDGAIWKFSDSRGQRMLMTVPPYLATSVETLLLPREVVESDK